MGPVIMITVGVLFLLDNLWLYGFQFHRTWPVILLVIGAVKILQTSGSTAGHTPVLPPSPPYTPAPPSSVAPPPEVQNG